MVFLFISFSSFGQLVSIAADKNYIFYLEVENPITIAVENNSCKSLIVKTNNGTIDGQNGRYVCKPKSFGKATITVFLKQSGKLKKIAKRDFMVRRMIDLPNIQVRIGPCINNCSVSADVLAAQEFISSDVVNTDINARMPIDSFSVYVYSNSTCKIINKKGNRITEDLKQDFRKLQVNDIVVFRNIYCTLLDKTTRELDPVMLFIKE